MRVSPLYDTGEAGTGIQLIGMGNQLKRDAYVSTLQHVSQCLQCNGHSGWLDPSLGVDPSTVSLCSYGIQARRQVDKRILFCSGTEPGEDLHLLHGSGLIATN